MMRQFPFRFFGTGQRPNHITDQNNTHYRNCDNIHLKPCDSGCHQASRLGSPSIAALYIRA